MEWIYLLTAGLFEALGVFGMGLAKAGALKKGRLISVFSILFSFGLLYLAMQTLPIGEAYAVWTGIGAAGGALIGILCFHESRSPKRLFFIGLIIVSVIGLRLVS